MVRYGAFLTGLLCVGILLGSHAYGDDETLTLNVCCKGKHTSPGANTTSGGYPFDLSGEITISAGVLSDGGEYALKAIFGQLADKKNGNAKVTKVSGDLKLAESKISGKVRVEWIYMGNPLWICGDIEGSIEMDDAVIHSIKFQCLNVEVGGIWNWGGGSAKLGGSGELSVSSRTEK